MNPAAAAIFNKSMRMHDTGPWFCLPPLHTKLNPYLHQQLRVLLPCPLCRLWPSATTSSKISSVILENSLSLTLRRCCQPESPTCIMSVTYKALLVPSRLKSRRKRRIFACMSAMTRRVPQMYVLCASPAVSDRCCESASPCRQAGTAMSDRFPGQKSCRHAQTFCLCCCSLSLGLQGLLLAGCVLSYLMVASTVPELVPHKQAPSMLLQRETF